MGDAASEESRPSSARSMERDSLHDEWTDDYAEEPKTPRTTPAPFQTSDKYPSHFS